ncbi:unnamed protein product [Sphagnum troendelagicum]|uniref:Homogentisate phytyltransferase n=1 Tax=Sphagnum troendelagicum TaxID=128251 RepID=A0ABP0TTN2_9BRYO
MEALNRAQIFNPRARVQAYQQIKLTAQLSQQRASICSRKTTAFTKVVGSQSMNQAPICHSPFGGVCISTQPICSHNGNVVPGRHILIQPYKAGRKLKFCILATARPMELDEGSAAPAADVEEVIVEAGVGWFDWFDPFSRFCRPHTIIGSALGVTSVSLMAVQSPADISMTFFVGLLQALIPALCMNVYIVGLNQIHDIEIDKVNKPYLPLASGEYSSATGIALVTTFAAVSLAIGAYVGSRPLMWALTVSLVLGTAYSVDLPFLRWKRSAIAAASCILVVRAIVVQLGFYLHMQVSVFRRAAVMTRPLWFITGFMCFFSIVIALSKDIPDVEGDRVFGIRSFSVRMGKKRVFWLCVWLLEAAYTAALVVGLTSPTLWTKVAMGVGHIAFASILWMKSQNVDLKSTASIAAWYMFIWKLFYAEYILIPFMR